MTRIPESPATSTELDRGLAELRRDLLSFDSPQISTVRNYNFNTTPPGWSVINTNLQTGPWTRGTPVDSRGPRATSPRATHTSEPKGRPRT